MAQSGQEYYGYLFRSDKKATKVLDSLLRGIANYIVESLGDKNEKSLTPAKLATFYKAVGGNYDSLFVDMPSPSISWIYASIGCQHTLEPTSDDFKPPSIPALTTRGFVRWQSIEILLGPEEHVPFIQNAVRNFAIKDPDTGETFPADLPTSAFPLVADKDIARWHSQCAEKLRQRATPSDDEDEEAPHLPPRPEGRPRMAYVRPGVRADYFEPKSRSRPIPYQHVSAASRPVRPKLSRSPTHQAKQFLAPEAPPSPYSRGRRRSFPENHPLSPSPNEVPSPSVHPGTRRYSHPHHPRQGSRSSDASSEGEDIDSPSHEHVKYSPDTRQRSHTHHSTRDDPPVIRFAPPPPTAATTPTDGTKPRRRISRDRTDDGDLKRQGLPIPIDVTGKLSAPFLLGRRGERRNGSRGQGVTWKDLNGVSVSEVDDEAPSDREKGGDSGSSGSRMYRRGRGDGFDRDMRPLLKERRYSSHEDVMRRHKARAYEREREREVVGRGTRRQVSPVRGVDGRKYPTGIR